MDSLATALYVTADDLVKAHPEQAPSRPPVGFAPALSDAELVTLAVMQALLGFAKERQWIRFAHAHLRHLFPVLPQQSGYNKRLRAAAGLIRFVIRVLAVDTRCWSDDVWVVDSTPVECGRSVDTVKRSQLAGWAEYGWCPSHSRKFWGLRLHLVSTLQGLPVMFALTGAKAFEPQVVLEMLDVDRDLVAARSGQVLIGDKGYFGKGFEQELNGHGLTLIRPTRAGEWTRRGRRFLRPLRQTVESVNQTLKDQLDLEHHYGRTPQGVTVRVLQRLLALTAVIWHNDHTGQPVLRSLTAFDH